MDSKLYYVQLMRYYDEVLSQSTRNYAFTSEPVWQKRYLEVQPISDKLLKDLKKNADSTTRDFFIQMDTASQKLIKMEYIALDFVNKGKREQSVALLDSEEYKKQRKILENGLEKFVKERISKNENSLVTDTENSVTREIISLEERLTDEKSKSLKVFQKVYKNLSDFQYALDASSLVAITDKEGVITYVNDKFCETSKYSRKELVGQTHRKIKSEQHSESFFENMWDTITSGDIWRGDIKNKAKDGSLYWVKTTIVPFLGEDGKPEQYIAIRTDITNQKKTEEKLDQSLIKLEENMSELRKSELLKEEFSSMVTHELKTPLTPIRGYCEMLLDKDSFGSLSDSQINFIKKIDSSAAILGQLIGDILDAQKIDMKRMTFDKESFEVDEFLDEFKQDSKYLMKDKGIKFSVIDSVNVTLTSDSRRLRQVLDNLVRNAIDFVPPKNGKIEVSVKQENGKMIFHVKDNGIGIPKEKQINIFKKFYQVDTSVTRKHGGTGLGLVICRGIIDALGGEIWFESEPGKETTFYFDILLESN